MPAGDRGEMEAERGIHFWCHRIRSIWIHTPCPICFIWRKHHQEQWAESQWQLSTLPSVGTSVTLWTGPVTASPEDKQLFSHFPLGSFLRTDHTELSQCDDRVNLRNFKKEQLLTSNTHFPPVILFWNRTSFDKEHIYEPIFFSWLKIFSWCLPNTQKCVREQKQTCCCQLTV